MKDASLKPCKGRDKFNTDEYVYVGGTQKKRTVKVRFTIEVKIELNLN